MGVVKVSVSLLAVVVDCHDALRQAEFWAQVLAYKDSQRNPGEFQVSDPAGVGGSLYFMKVPEPKVGKNRLHLGLVTSGSMEDEVMRLLGAGAHLVEVRQDPASLDNPDTWTVMRDPEGTSSASRAPPPSPAGTNQAGTLLSAASGLVPTVLQALGWNALMR